MRMFTPYTPASCFVDLLLNCGVVLFGLTIYSSTPWLYNILLMIPAIIIFVVWEPAPSPSKKASGPSSKEATKQVPLDRFPVKPFITNYRAAMLVITCIAILAVDFQVFPRRFAKVENWGTSIMDMGVGSFVFTAGVVSVRSSLKETGRRPPLLRRLVGSIRHSIPLLILGFARLISVKGLDYAEHVTEYGIHWNFFFTLGLLPPFTALFQSFFDIVPSYAVLSCVLAALYQLALDKTDLKKFILTAERTDLLSQNREGIFSFIGYLAIFLAGQSLGSFALPRQEPPPKDASTIQVIKSSIFGKLTISAVIWTALFYFSISYYGLGLTVSRRLANLPYFLWVSSYNNAQIAICCAIEGLCFPNIYKASGKEEEMHRGKDATSPVLSAFNRNGLVVFLVANLLTGLINLTLDTLKMSVLGSMAVLVAYTTVVAGLALGLDRLDVSIKL